MKNLAKLVMILTVCIVIIGGTLAPYVDGVTAETLTYTNEGMPYAAVDEDTHTITVTSTTITVDGEEIDQTLFPSGFDSYSIVYAENGFIRFDTSNVQVGVADSSLSGYGYTTYSLDSYTVTVTIAGDAATITTTDTTATSVSIPDVLYYIATEGDYVLALNPYVNSENLMYGAGVTWISSSTGVPTGFYEYLVWSGTVEGVTGEVVAYSNQAIYTLAYSDSEVNYTEIEDGLYCIDSIEINCIATYISTGDEYDTTVTYTYFLAPSEVVYDNPDYLGSANAAILLAIVVITIAALLAATARYVARDY